VDVAIVSVAISRTSSSRVCSSSKRLARFARSPCEQKHPDEAPHGNFQSLLAAFPEGGPLAATADIQVCERRQYTHYINVMRAQELSRFRITVCVQHRHHQRRCQLLRQEWVRSGLGVELGVG